MKPWGLICVIGLLAACEDEGKKTSSLGGEGSPAVAAAAEPRPPPAPVIREVSQIVIAGAVAAKQTPNKKGKWAATLFVGEELTVLEGSPDTTGDWAKVRLCDDETEAFIERRWLGDPDALAVVTEQTPLLQNPEYWTMPCPKEEEGLMKGTLVVVEEHAESVWTVKLPGGRRFYLPAAVLETGSEDTIQMGRAAFAYRYLRDKGKEGEALDVIVAAASAGYLDPDVWGETEFFDLAVEVAGQDEDEGEEMTEEARDEAEFLMMEEEQERALSRAHALMDLLAGEWIELSEYRDGKYRFEEVACAPIETPERLILDSEAGTIIYGPDREARIEVVDATVSEGEITFLGIARGQDGSASNRDTEEEGPPEPDTEITWRCQEGSKWIQRRVGGWSYDGRSGLFGAPWARDDFKWYEDRCDAYEGGP